jgi:transposase
VDNKIDPFIIIFRLRGKNPLSFLDFIRGVDVKEWNMIHKVISLYDNGDGLGKKTIARQLKISVNTVRKYLDMDEETINIYLTNKNRTKNLDAYRVFIVHLLETFPQLSAVKVQRKLQEKYPELTQSSRTIRRYVNQLRKTISSKQIRYYQPVLDHVPGEQCQVDPGELRGVIINGVETTVYFVVFVLSCSRLMYVALSNKAIDTQCFIEMHDAAFRYFGGVTAECVYDQTKLVVIEEVYRELILNSRFNEYATLAGFRIHACEGYDPESKGKVEAGVKYVKGNALYGETFDHWSSLEHYLINWLDTIANRRIHATTGEVPQEHYEKLEQSHMKAYLSPSVVRLDGQAMTRKVDKTGLISYLANKYSVPMVYQRSTVGITIKGQHLHVIDLETGEEVAQHSLTSGKGKVIKNTHHYRDPTIRIERLEEEMRVLIGQPMADILSPLLKTNHPKIYKDQLAGVVSLLKQYQPVAPALLEKLCQRPRLSATLVRDFLQAYQAHPERIASDKASLAPRLPSGQLDAYGSLTQQEAS